MTIELKKPGVSPPEKIIIKDEDCKRINSTTGWDIMCRCPMSENHQNNDDNFSLSVNEGEKRAKCTIQACGFAAIFWDEKLAYKTKSKRDKILKSRGQHDIAWVYYDKDGVTPLTRACRVYKPKGVTDPRWQECYHLETKSWWYGLRLPKDPKPNDLKAEPGGYAKLVIYNWKRILDNPDKKVFILEGEKSCDYFWTELGLIATTNPGGAGNWKKEFSKFLKDRIIGGIPDNDPTGAVHVIKVGNSLAGICKSYKIIRLPGLRDKEDSDDWINNCKKMGMTRTQMIGSLKEYIDKAEEYVPDIIDELQIQEKFNSVIFGRIIRDHYAFISTPAGQFYMYLPKWKMWFKEGEYLLRQILRQYYLEDKDWQSNKVSEVVIYIRDIVRKNRIEMEQLTPPPTLIPFNNCIIDMSEIIKERDEAKRTGNVNPKKTKPKILEYSKDHFFLSKLAVDYNPEHKTCPRLDEIFSQLVTAEDLPILYEIPAYSLWRSYPENKMFTLWGGGHNGKTQYGEAIIHLLGKENITAWSSKGLGKKFALATLQDKYANIGSEESEMTIKDVAVLKDITGGGTITAQNKFKNPFEFTPFCKIILIGNRLPSSPILDDAWIRRQYPICFPYQFTKDGTIPVIKKIMETIKQEEWEGLAYKLINEYLPRLIRNDWEFTNEMGTEEMRAYYTQEVDPVRTFVSLFCNRTITGYIPCGEFKEKCVVWLTEQGKVYSLREVADAMGIKGSMGIENKARNHPTQKDLKTNKPVRCQCYCGIEWKEDNVTTDDMSSSGMSIIRNANGKINFQTSLDKYLEKSKKVFPSTGEQNIEEINGEYIKPEDNPLT